METILTREQVLIKFHSFFLTAPNFVIKLIFLKEN